MLNNILLVDDDKDFREEFKDSFAEYNVIEASNGKEALKVLNKPNDIDLVILDVMLPDVSGTEILKKIKEMSLDINIIILTGYSSKDIAIESLRGHADEYIEKPFDIFKAKKIIAKLLYSKKEIEDQKAGDSEGKIERVKRFVERNSHKRICLKDVAQAVCLSPKYLSRVFKQIMGMGFTEYRLKVKINAAKDLLGKTGYNIDQVADKIGYQNTESFIRQFKKIIHCTPTEYRRKNRPKGKAIVVEKKKIKLNPE